MAFNESQCISTSATDAGNITSRKEYARTNSEKGELLDTVVYTYDDSEWGDLLTAYDGKPITYDGIGNILTYDGWTFNWEHGRELASMSKDTVTWTYTYDANGMRTSRTNGTTTYNYVYNGSQLTQMTVGTDTLCFTYDASGIPTTVTLNGVVYYYITNMQGDVVGIYTADGTSVCYYNYDAWGRPVTVTNDDNYTIDDLNPLRYRGYVFDQDTGLYYLQSRYYNPEWGRFINADAFVSTGQGILGNNMFAYCRNNPVRRIDISGTLDYECDEESEDLASGNRNDWAKGGNSNSTKTGTNSSSGPGTNCLRIGSGHGSPTHSARINSTMDSLVNSGNCKAVYGNRALSTAGLNGSQRPDIIAIYNDGTCEIWEFASKSQATGTPGYRALGAKMQAIRLANPTARMNDIIPWEGVERG